jgi:hypothetical protein
VFRGRYRNNTTKTLQRILSAILLFGPEEPSFVSWAFFTFEVPVLLYTESNLRNPDKAQLRTDILSMHQQGMSYRKIGAALGIHWSQVGQIISNAESLNDYYWLNLWAYSGQSSVQQPD